jgi:hypothetical protein
MENPMTLQKIILATVAAVLLTMSPAYAKQQSCIHWKEGDTNTFTVHGTIVATEDSTMLVADRPVCGFGSLIVTGPTDPHIENPTRQWLGKRVEIEGFIEEVGDHGSRIFTVKSVQDDEHCQGSQCETETCRSDTCTDGTSHNACHPTQCTKRKP